MARHRPADGAGAGGKMKLDIWLRSATKFVVQAT